MMRPTHQNLVFTSLLLLLNGLVGSVTSSLQSSLANNNNEQNDLFLRRVNSHLQQQQQQRRQLSDDIFDHGPTVMHDRLLLITIEGRPSALVDQDFWILEYLFTESYNYLTYLNCPNGGTTTYVNMTNITFDFDNIESYGSEPRIITGTTDFSLLLEATLECGSDCDEEIFTMFQHNITGYYYDDDDDDDTTDGSSTRRKTRKLDGYTFPSSNTCVPTEEEFRSILTDALMLYTNLTDLDGLDYVLDVTELEHYSDETFATCKDENSRDAFSSTSTVAVQGSWASATPAQMKELETVIIDVYNGLNALNPNLCDGESRVVTSASVEIYNEQGIQFNPSTGRLLLQEEEGDDEKGLALSGSSSRQRRSLNANWWYLKIGKGGTCYGCPKDSCMTNDVSGYSKSKCAAQKKRRELTNDYSASCYCAPGVPRTLPTTTDFMNELNEAIQLLRNEPNFGFDFISSIVYAVEADNPPNSCCGYPTDEFIPVPSNVDFQQAITDYLVDPQASPYGFPLNCWDVSQVTDMSFAFAGLPSFDEELDCWETSNVTSMTAMFYNAATFDQDLLDWNTTNVINMDSMFFGASNFKGLGLQEWDISSLESATHMFGNAQSFNQDLCNWSDIDYELTGVTAMFVGSGCDVTSVDPTPAVGPYCHVC